MLNNLSANLVVVLTSLLLLFAPIVRGGKTSMAAATMEILGLIILLIIFWTGLHKGKIARPVLWFIWGGLGSIVIYLLPLPDSLWSILPGREVYIESANWLEKTGDITVYKALSIVPLNTLSLLLACIPALAVFLAGIALPKPHLLRLVYALIASAFIQALIGIIQYITNDPYYHFGVGDTLAVQGTYLNQNHLTAFLEMTEPLALGLMIYAIINPEPSKLKKIIKITFFGFISLVLTFIPLISSSRMGVALLLLSIILSFWAMTTKTIRKKVVAPIFALRAALLIIAIIIQFNLLSGLTEIITTELSSNSPSESSVAATGISRITEQAAVVKITGDLRWELWLSGINGIKEFFPIGSGPSSFQHTYQTYKPYSIAEYVGHLHNDYLQLAYEFGLVGITTFVLFIFMYVHQWTRIATTDELLRLIQSAAGVGILLFLLYSITDFSLHTPANIIFLSLICGIFFKKTQSLVST